MSNPVLNEKFLQSERVLDGEPMTVNGAINKTMILFVCLLISAIYTWSVFAAGFAGKAQILMTGGAITGLILAIIIMVKRGSQAVKYLVPAYAIAQGFFIGGISAIYNHVFNGIVVQAVLCTFGALGMMLFLYRIGAIRATEKFRSVMILALSSIFVIYLIQILASIFGRSIPQIFSASPIGIGFSVIVCIFASLTLILDFDFIERGSEAMLDKSYEWQGAFGLMVTLVWLYVEILNLLAKLNSRN